jgi:hypothetical protein
MARFEVLVPGAPPARPADVTLRIDAESWLAALEAGLDRLGGPRFPSNVLCDVQADGAILVTDPRGGGVFRIREVTAAPRPAPDAPAATGFSGSPAPGAACLGGSLAPPSIEDVLVELFGRVADLDPGVDRAGGLAFLLDLALEKIECEAGSVFLARPGGGELDFAVVRGPRADEIRRLGLTVPTGAGIVGFCVSHDVGLAVSDAERDPRFHRTVSVAVGHPARSLLCAPMAKRGMVLGAFELVNRRGGGPFGGGELAVLSYLAHQGAELVWRTGA